MTIRPGLFVPLALLGAVVVFSGCRTLRMGRDVPLDLLSGELEEDETEPETAGQGLEVEQEAEGEAGHEVEVEVEVDHKVEAGHEDDHEVEVEHEVEHEAEAEHEDDHEVEVEHEDDHEVEHEADQVAEVDQEDEADAGGEAVAVAETRSWLTGRQLTSEGTSAAGCWDADGAQIIFESVRTGGVMANPNPQTWLMDADGGRQRRITMGIGVTQGPGFVAMLGRTVFYGSTHHTGQTPTVQPGTLPDEMELYRQDLDQGGFERLTDSPGYDGDATWCRQDGQVVFTSTRDGDPELYALTDAQEATRLTSSPGRDHSAILSPDCSRLAWIRDGALWVARADGSLGAIVVPSRASAPAWHPDGELLVFAASAEPAGPTDLFTVNAAGSDLRRLTFSSGSEGTPSFSPDGQRLLYSWDRTGTPQLFVSPWHASMGTPWEFWLP